MSLQAQSDTMCGKFLREPNSYNKPRLFVRSTVVLDNTVSWHPYDSHAVSFYQIDRIFSAVIELIAFIVAWQYPQQ